MEKHDVVVIGAGHNGLTVGAYLAKAGVDVCVLERLDQVGGGVITREFNLPGFKYDWCSTMHIMIQANPMIHRDELELKAKYGLKYIYPEPQLAMVFPDDRALIVYRDVDKTAQSIAQFSKKDAAIYPKFVEYCRKLSKVAAVATFSPPVPFGRMMSLLDSSEDGREFMRVILSSSLDIAFEWFESDQMRTLFSRYAAEGMVGPNEKGTGNAAFMFPLFHSWGFAMPEGGSGELSESLARCIRDHKGTVKINSPVKTVIVENGEAKGVRLENGEEIMATRAIVSNLNVKQLFLQLLKPDELPAGFPDKVGKLKQATFVPINIFIALNEQLHYKAGKEVDNAAVVEINPFLDRSLQAYEEYTHGIPNWDLPLVSPASVADPTRAPKGKHSLYFYHFEPYNLKDGGPQAWDKIKEKVADGMIEVSRRHITNFTDSNILARTTFSPLDYERHNPSFITGDFLHIGIFLDQLFANRPMPGWGQYKTPIKKLYMCGASTHPGGGVTGGGRAAVQVVMEDLKIDFKKVISK